MKRRAPIRKKNKGGRPTILDRVLKELDWVYDFCLLGATNEDLANHFGVSEKAIERWLRENEKFRGVVRAGREEADAKVARSMYEVACGYSHPDTKFVSKAITDDKGNVRLLVKGVPIIKHYPPHVGAGKNWLTNRQKTKWQNRISMEHSGPGGGPIDIRTPLRLDFSNFNPEELKKLRDLGYKIEEERQSK